MRRDRGVRGVVGLSSVLFFGSFLGCGEQSQPETDVGAGIELKFDARGVLKQGEEWSQQDSPFIFTSRLETRFDALPLAGEATKVPWAGSYWPTAEDNINYQWDGAASDSPAKKYERAFGGSNVEDAVSRHHGIDSATSQKSCTASSECDSSMGEICATRRGRSTGRCIPTWWGICHAWTPAAILLPEPKKPVVRNGVTFEVQDLKGLASLVYNSSRSKFVSTRCNLNSSGSANLIKLDEYGRPTDANRACRDTNAGTYHILLANYLGLMRQAFAEDRTNDYQVWNQPLRGYKVLSSREVSFDEANRLVGVTAATDGATLATYRFNRDAKRFIEIKATVQYISESSAEDGHTGNTIDRYTRTDRYQYVLELDSAGKILGGEWIGSSKRDHPDFLWLPIGAGSGPIAGGAISYETVKAMVAESAESSVVPPPTPPAPPAPPPGPVSPPAPSEPTTGPIAVAVLEATPSFTVVASSLNCRRQGGLRGPIVTTHRQGSTLVARPGTALRPRVSIDERGKPWLLVQSADGVAGCYVSASYQYVKPIR
jgi:hypothetical protein